MTIPHRIAFQGAAIMRIRITRSSLRLFFVFLVVISIGHAAFAQSAHDEARRILSKETSAEQSDELARVIEQMTEEEQIDLFVQLFEMTPPPDAVSGRSMSGSAAGALIRRKYDDEAFIDSLTVKVGDGDFYIGYLFQELQSRASKEDTKRLTVYLKVLRSARTAAMQRYAETGEGLGTIDYAVLLESRIAGAASLADAREVLRTAPDSRGAWVVLLSHDAVGDEEIETARQIFFDDERWASSHQFLIAAALIEHVPEAARFIETAIDAAIEQYGDHTYEEIVLRSYGAARGRGPEEDKGINSRFLSAYQSSLQYLPLIHNDHADPLIRKSVKVTNEMIRNAALYAVVKSRPRLVLENPPILDDEKAMLTLAAAVAVEHPDLVPQLKQRFSADQLEREMGGIDYIVVGDWLKLPNPIPQD